MSTRELVVHELKDLPEQDFDKLLSFFWSLKEVRDETNVPMVAAESLLSKDWLTREEDEDWADL